MLAIYSTDYVAVDNRASDTLSLYFWNQPSSTFNLQILNLNPANPGDTLDELMVCKYATI